MIDSLDMQALRLLGFNPALLPQLPLLSDTPTPPGSGLWRVTEVQRDQLSLQCTPTLARRARPRPALQQQMQAADAQFAVGDWVLAAEADDTLWVQQRLQPLNLLSRRDPEGRRQALVSNVDTALLVMGLDHDFKLARLDRYLVLTRAAGVAAVVVLSKADLCRDPREVQARIAEVEDHLAHSRSAVQAVLALDGTRPATTRERLAPWLGAGQTLVLLGSSGAGKSTLTNSLCDAPLQATGGVRLDDSRGRHTTTARSLHHSPDGACIIDTPGLRGLQLDASRAELQAAFDDVSTLAGACRFRDCRHQNEPGCAVRDALSPARLRSYQKLQREARREDLGPLEKRAQMQQWKARSRLARGHIRSKRGDEG